jgi:hypothetical protein
VSDHFALALQEAFRVGQQGSEIETEVDPIGVGGGEDEGVARTAGEGEVIGDGVDLVDELAGFRGFGKDEAAGREGEGLDGGE